MNTRNKTQMLCLLSYDCVSHSDVSVICQKKIISCFSDGLYLPEESVFSGRRDPPNYLLSPCMNVVCSKCIYQIMNLRVRNAESLHPQYFLPAASTAKQDILQECLQGLNIGPETGRPIRSAHHFLLTAAI